MPEMGPNETLIVTVFNDPQMGVGTWLPLKKETIEETRTYVKQVLRSATRYLAVRDPITNETVYLIIANLGLVRVTTVEGLEQGMALYVPGGMSEEPADS